MKKLLPLLLLAATAASAQKPPAPAENLVQYAHPIIGTQKMGHTYPGATVPFGMVQLSPDTGSFPVPPQCRNSCFCPIRSSLKPMTTSGATCTGTSPLTTGPGHLGNGRQLTIPGLTQSAKNGYGP